MSTNNPLAAFEDVMAGIRQQVASLEQMRANFARIQAQPQAAAAQGPANPDAYQRIISLYARTPQGQEQTAKYNQAFTSWLQKEGHTARMAEEMERLKIQFENATPEAKALRANAESAAMDYVRDLADRAEAAQVANPTVERTPPKPRGRQKVEAQEPSDESPAEA